MTPRHPGGFLLQPDLNPASRRVLAAGALLLAISIAGGIFNPREFFYSYLIGYLLWINLALGSLGFLMLQYLTGGAWGVVARRVLEAIARTTPFLAILFVPLAFGLSELYPWARPASLQHTPVLEHRAAYMNIGFFLARAALYLAVWIVLATLLNRWSFERDRERAVSTARLSKLSAAGLILYLFTASFASIDWAESLEIDWASSMWGFMFIAAQAITAMSFVILVLAFLSRRLPMSNVIRPSHFHDAGKLLFASLMLWAYFAFCQYLIVWSANLVHEISYYLVRTLTSWHWVGVSLVIFQFFLPAVLLLSRPLKRNRYLMSAVAAVILFMQYVDLLWIVLPAEHRNGFQLHWLNVTTPLALGGVWMWAFLRELPRRPLLPLNVADQEEVLAHESR